MAKLNRQRYDEISSRIRKVGGNSASTEDTVLFVADTLSNVIDGVTGGAFGTINTACQTLYKSMKASADSNDPLIPNPWFVLNGHEDAENTRTLRYLESRAWKSIGSSSLSLAGTAASASTAGVNVADIAIHGNAVLSTDAHLDSLIAIASDKRYKEARAIQDWLRLVVAMKRAKAGVRAGSLLGGIIPGAAVPVGIATTVAKMGIKLTMSKACLTTSAAIHWRAYQEQKISGGLKLGTGGRIGPASRIFWEIFTRRGLTAMFGKYDIDALVREPGGWLALNDKLMLI
jgi:hypothetical protein